ATAHPIKSGQVAHRVDQHALPRQRQGQTHLRQKDAGLTQQPDRQSQQRGANQEGPEEAVVRQRQGSAESQHQRCQPGGQTGKQMNEPGCRALLYHCRSVSLIHYAALTQFLQQRLFPTLAHALASRYRRCSHTDTAALLASNWMLTSCSTPKPSSGSSSRIRPAAVSTTSE